MVMIVRWRSYYLMPVHHASLETQCKFMLPAPTAINPPTAFQPVRSCAGVQGIRST